MNYSAVPPDLIDLWIDLRSDAQEPKYIVCPGKIAFSLVPFAFLWLDQLSENLLYFFTGLRSVMKTKYSIVPFCVDNHWLPTMHIPILGYT